MIFAVLLAVAALGSSGLEARLTQLAAPARGVVGVSAVHVESGRSFALRGDEAFPMASVCKLPIAIAFLRGIERGQVQIGDSVTLGSHWWRTGRSHLSGGLVDHSIRVAWGDVLKLAVAQSDNAAADVLLRRVGGPAAVMRAMRELGIQGVRVDRSEGGIAMALAGVEAPPPENTWSKALFDSVYAVAGRRRLAEERGRYALDPRDTCTPNGIARLLVVLHQGRALNRENTERLLAIMRRSPTGTRRIRALLPKSARVADKTGSQAETSNDVGFVVLPEGRGHLAVAVLIKASKSTPSKREQVIARIARALYDEVRD